MKTKKQQPIRCLAIFFVLLFSLVIGNFALAATTVPTQPMYVGVVELFPTIAISSSGNIKCSDTITLKSGYTANVTWELNYGTGSKLSPLATWTGSGSRTISLQKERYATHGYNYQLKTTAKVYDSNKNYIETAVRYSSIVSY